MKALAPSCPAPRRSARWARGLQPLGLVVSLALAYAPAHALPQGGQVVQGQALLSPGLVQQTSDKAIVNWQSFSIGAGETLRVQQPGVNSVLLNRVVGRDPSLILGQLQANGRVFLVNPRGIVFGRGSQVDAGSLVASTLDLSDGDFLAGAYRFSAGASAGGLRAEGRLSAADGTVALLAPDLAVSGQITARRVGLAAASHVQVDVEGDGLVLFNLRNDDRDVALKFSGQVLAEGGSVEMRAQARAGAVGQVLNMDGLVQARSLRQQGGRILIDGGTAGDTLVGGQLDASGQTGGQVTVLGQRVGLLDAARVNASGRAGGGQVRIGGGVQGQGTTHNAEDTVVAAGAEIHADATEQGSGGLVAVWADRRTDMRGRISARGGAWGGDGGFVETSGRASLRLTTGRVDVAAPRGRAGQWLLDPYDLTIQDPGGAAPAPAPTPPSLFEPTAASSVLDVRALNDALGTGASVTISTGSASSPGAQAGNITVDGDIRANGASSLSLQAAGGISFTALGQIRSTSGALAVNLTAKTGVDTAAGSIDTLGGPLTVTAPAGASLGTVHAGAVTVDTSGGSGGITLGSLDAGQLTLTAGAGLTTLGAGRVTGLSVTTAGGAIGQGPGALAVNGAASLTTGAGSVTLTDLSVDDRLDLTTTTGPVSLGKITALGGLTFHSTSGALLQTDALTLGGGADISTSGSVSLDAVGNALAGPLVISAGNTRLRSDASTPLTLGLTTVNGTLDITAPNPAGSLVQTGRIAASGVTTLNVQGPVALPDLANAWGSGLDIRARALDLGAAGNLSLLGLSLAPDQPLRLRAQGQLDLGPTASLDTGAASLTLSSGGDFTVASRLAGQDLSLSAANRLTLANDITAAGRLSLAAGASLLAGVRQTAGRLTVGGETTVSTGSGLIQLDAGNNHFADVVSLHGGTTLLRADAALTLGASAVGALTVTTAGLLTQSGVISATGDVVLNAGSAAVSLANPGNDLRGDITISGTAVNLATQGDLRLVSLSQGGQPHALSLDAGGALSLPAGLTVLDTGSAALWLASRGAAFTTPSTLRGGDITLTGRSVVLAHDISASQALVVQATAGDVVQQQGRLTLTGTASSRFTAAGGDIDLRQAGNTLRGPVDLDGRQVQLLAQGDLTLGRVDATGALQVRSTTGQLLQTAQGVSAGDAATLQAAGTITLDAGANQWGGPVSLSGGATRLQGQGAVVLDAVGVSALWLKAAGPVSQRQAIGLTGALTVDAGTADIDLTAAGNLLSGVVSLTGNTARVHTQGPLTLGQLTLGGDLSASSNGLLKQAAGPWAIAGKAGLDAGTAAVQLDDPGNRWGGAVSLKGGAVTLAGGAITLGSVDVGSLDLKAQGAIGQDTTSVKVAGRFSVEAGTADVDLRDPDNQFSGAVTLKGRDIRLTTQGALTLDTLDTRALEVAAGTSVMLGQGTISGTLRASSGSGDITQADALHVSGAATLNAGGRDILLADTGNEFFGPLSLSGRAVTIFNRPDLSFGTVTFSSLDATSQGALTLGTGSLSGNLIARALGGAITQVAGGLVVNGTATLQASTGISLNEPGNQWRGVLNLQGGSTSLTRLTSDTALRLGSVNTGALALTANGAITQAQALSVQGTASLNAGAAPILLDATGNQFSGALSLTGGAVQLNSGSALSLGSLQVASLTVQSSGGLQLGSGAVTGNLVAVSRGAPMSQASGGLSVGGATTLDAGGGTLQLAASGNNFLGLVGLTAGDATLATSGSLSLSSATARNLTLVAGGDLVLGSGAVAGDFSATTRGLHVSQTQPFTVQGATRFVADAALVDLSLDHPGNQWRGLVEVSGINGGRFLGATLGTAGDLSFKGDAQALTLNSGGRLTLGGGQHQTLTAAARSGIAQTGALSVSGETTLIARGGAGMSVDLAQAGNDFNRLTLAAEAGGSLGSVQLREADAGRRDGLQVTGDAATLEVTSAGALAFGGGRYTRLTVDTSGAGADITQAAGLTVSGMARFQAGTGNLSLTRPDNQLPTVVVGSAATASLVSQGDFAVEAGAVSTRLALGGPGAISLVGSFSGSGELQMNGSGSLTLDRGHGYSGGTRIDAGRLVLQGAAAQPGTGAVRLGAAGQLDLRDGATLANGLVVQGGRITSSAGAGTLAGPVTLQGDAQFEPGLGGLTVTGAMADGGAGFGLRLAGTGSLALAGVNRYSGITDIASGSLLARVAGALPETSAVQLAAGATLTLAADQAIGSLAGSGQVALGSFSLAAGADGRDSRFSGSLMGAGGFSKRGLGRLTLDGSNLHSGATRVEAGELVLASSTALSEATAVTVEAGARLTVQQASRLGALAGAGTVDVQAAQLAVGANGDSTRWAGSLTGRGALIKLGAGRLTLAGSNSFSGGLQVQAGVVALEGTGLRPLAAAAAAPGPVLPAGTAVSVAAGAALAVLADAGFDTLTGAGDVQLGSSTLTLGTAGGTSRFDGGFTGAGNVVKTGAGNLTLGGSSHHTGFTRVAEGELVLAAPQTLGGASALVIDAPGRVQVQAAQTVASLAGSGALQLGADLATGADGRDSRFDGLISGSGGLVKQGAGLLTLTAANTHSGANRIEAGAVRLSGQGLLGRGDLLNDGQLLLARSEALTLDQAVSGRGSLVIEQGDVTLASAGNRYTGATQVQAGRLITTAADRLPDGSALQVAAGAQLELGGSDTVASLQAAGNVRLAGSLTTTGEQVYTGSLTLASPGGLTLAGSRIDAGRLGNLFASAPLGLQAGEVQIKSAGTLALGEVSLARGGRIEAERLSLDGRLQISGGSLDLVATATPDEALATRYGTAQVPVAGLPLALAEATVQQGAAGVIALAEGARLQVTASGGGSVLLTRDANSFKGELAVLSGAGYGTAWQPQARGSQAIQSQVRVSGQQLLVGGSGIEADLVALRADQLATAGTSAVVARLPYDAVVLGRALSAPGLTLDLAAGAFGVPGSFGSINGQAIQVVVGSTETGARTTGPNAGFVTVLPKAGAQGATAVVLVGPKVGSALATGGAPYRFFHDGAARPVEIPVVYNGVLPLTPAAAGTLSSINGDAEDARRARFQDTVRTENVTVRLRAGVIAEVGPGRASTQGSEGTRPPELCDPAERPALSCKTPSSPP